MPPQDTVYGSHEWGNQDILDILKDYPQVVSFSGHSHYSLLDERSIHQKDFTAVNTQSLSYIELEGGYENGSIPRDEYESNSISESNPMAILMTINSQAIQLDRIMVIDNKLAKDPWVIPLPISKDTFEYTLEKQKAGREAPVFMDDNVISVVKATNIYQDDINLISFQAAQHIDFVHTYKLVFNDNDGNILGAYETNHLGQIVKYDDKGQVIPYDSKKYVKGNPKTKTEFLYFSDFHQGIHKMSDIVTLRLPYHLPKGAMKVSIYAIDSFGYTSEPITKSIVID